MEALEFAGLVNKALNVNSQAKLLLFLSALSLLLLLLLHSEALVLISLWGTLGELFKGPVSAFLTLNCVIATIIASSRMESSANVRGRELHEAEKDEKETVLIDDVKRTAVMHDEERSLDDDNLQQEAVEAALFEGVINGGEEGLIDNQEEQVLISNNHEDGVSASTSSVNNHGDKLHAEDPQVIRRGHAGDMINRDQAGAAASGGGDQQEAPSLEQVWASIVSENKVSSSPLAVLNSSDTQINGGAAAIVSSAAPAEGAAAAAIIRGRDQLSTASTTDNTNNNDGGLNEVCAAAARVSSTVATRGAAAPAPAPRAAENLRRAGGGGGAGKTSISREEEVEDKDGEDVVAERREVEELNRRAEEFIARVNQQMRLQRLESLQRRRQRRSRRCHHHHQYYAAPPHQQQQFSYNHIDPYPHVQNRLLSRPPPAASAVAGLLVG